MFKSDLLTNLHKGGLLSNKLVSLICRLGSPRKSLSFQD